jgi:hypothetical protein
MRGCARLIVLQTVPTYSIQQYGPHPAHAALPRGAVVAHVCWHPPHALCAPQELDAGSSWSRHNPMQSPTASGWLSDEDKEQYDDDLLQQCEDGVAAGSIICSEFSNPMLVCAEHSPLSALRRLEPCVLDHPHDECVDRDMSRLHLGRTLGSSEYTHVLSHMSEMGGQE